LNDADNNDHLDIENMEVFIDNTSNAKRKRGVGVWGRHVRNYRMISGNLMLYLLVKLKKKEV